MKIGPKILLLDIETAPLLSYTWGLFDQNIGLNQIHTDWHLLSWAAKWLGENKVFYEDQRAAKNIENDKELLRGIWKLLDECDVVCTQNGISFDIKKLNARFVFHGTKPPSTYRQIDTLRIARKRFGFTSNKLAYLTDKLCTKYKKMTVREFEGFELWRECLKGNIDAWREMERYNKRDVLSLEELYEKLAPWDTAVNLAVYYADPERRCNCGNQALEKRGFSYTQTGKFQRYRCHKCGAWLKDKKNLLSGKDIKRSA